MGTGLQASHCSLATLIHLLTWCKIMMHLEASFSVGARAMLLPANNAKGERPTEYSAPFRGISKHTESEKMQQLHNPRGGGAGNLETHLPRNN